MCIISISLVAQKRRNFVGHIEKRRSEERSIKNIEKINTVFKHLQPVCNRTFATVSFERMHNNNEYPACVYIYLSHIAVASDLAYLHFNNVITHH